MAGSKKKTRGWPRKTVFHCTPKAFKFHKSNIFLQIKVACAQILLGYYLRCRFVSQSGCMKVLPTQSYCFSTKMFLLFLETWIILVEDGADSDASWLGVCDTSGSVVLFVCRDALGFRKASASGRALGTSLYRDGFDVHTADEMIYPCCICFFFLLSSLLNCLCYYTSYRIGT